MTRPTQHVGTRSSSLALLGVSTIVLAATGETLWHANATASEGRWAAPTVGVEAVAAAENAAAAGENEVNAMTVPDFKPFVMVRVPLPSGYSQGEVLGLNNSNQAVGWMWNSSAGKALPFLFTPPSTVLILDLPTGSSAGQALGISDADPPVIVGSVYDDSEAFDVPVWWDANGDFGDYVYDDVTPGYTFGVNADGWIVGVYKNPTNPFAFAFDGAYEWNPAYGTQSAARAVNSGGKVVGWHLVSSKSHAYSWVENTTTDINPSGYDYSEALTVNDAGHIGGWVADTDESEKIPALWTFVIPGVYTVEPFDMGASSAVTALNSHGEMAITREDDSGAAIWTKRTGVDDADLLDDLTLMRGGSDVLHSAWAINDNGWIGGSYLAGGTGDPQPCLIIPYDVDNDGSPDYREILEGKRQGFTDLDTNNNWLLDWAENISGAGMRTGLHSPPFSNSPPHTIDEAQIVRLQVFLQGPQQGQGLDGVDEFTIQEAIDGPSGFCEGVKRWSRDNVDREIVVWLRSTLNRTGYSWTKDNDILPENESQRTQILSDLLAFSHHYAHCIDYIQLGNEVFGGAGQYMFTAAELSSCGSWSGFEEWGGLSNTCKAAASPIVLDWLDDLMWAALEGSALAGRPYRIVSPAMLGAHVQSGHGNSSTVAFQVIDGVSEWANERQMFFDLHVHYQSYALFTETTQKITDTYSGGPAGWDVPHRIVVLEWGPTANGDWVGANAVDYSKFREESGCQDPPSYEDWEDFVATWKADEEGPWQGDFSITDSLDDMAALGFHFVCYGPVGQHENANLKYDMKCLWANKTCDEFITDEDFITPMKAEFVAAATEHQITFSTRIACPDCPGN